MTAKLASYDYARLEASVDGGNDVIASYRFVDLAPGK